MQQEVNEDLLFALDRAIKKQRVLIRGAFQKQKDACSDRATGDQGDRASRIEECMQARSEFDRAATYLQRLTGQKVRVKNGLFDGRCVDCGHTIDVDRLVQQPSTTHCAPCKTECEKRDQRLYGVRPGCHAVSAFA